MQKWILQVAKRTNFEVLTLHDGGLGLCSVPTMVRFSRPWSDIRLFFQKSLIFGLILVKIATF